MPNFDKHPGVRIADKSDPFKTAAIALRADTERGHSVLITNRNQLIEVVSWLLETGKDLP